MNGYESVCIKLPKIEVTSCFEKKNFNSKGK